MGEPVLVVVTQAGNFESPLHARSTVRYAQLRRRSRKAGVERPERVAGETGGDKQLHVVPADTSTVELVSFDEIEAFLGGSSFRAGKVAQSRQRMGALREVPACQFAEDDWVDGNPFVCQGCREILHAAPEMLNPDRCVGEDHLFRLEVGRRRDGTASAGMVPPREARRRADSRWMSASNPMRTSAVFSASPVYSPACASSASSIFSVVLMHTLMPPLDISVKCI